MTIDRRLDALERRVPPVPVPLPKREPASEEFCAEVLAALRESGAVPGDATVRTTVDLCKAPPAGS